MSKKVYMTFLYSQYLTVFFKSNLKPGNLWYFGHSSIKYKYITERRIYDNIIFYVFIQTCILGGLLEFKPFPKCLKKPVP